MLTDAGQLRVTSSAQPYRTMCYRKIDEGTQFARNTIHHHVVETNYAVNRSISNKFIQ